mmetsp:Transcript_96561/g.272972  ORF Transcript_96561/g.272972 Transcript_96561/m.272972 type:complete len:503 (+) Transcript_96561:48-1556(+)
MADSSEATFAQAKKDILEQFDATFQDGRRVLQRDQLAAIMRRLLPEVTAEEVDLMLSAAGTAVAEDGTARYDSFIAWLIDGQPGAEREQAARLILEGKTSVGEKARTRENVSGDQAAQCGVDGQNPSAVGSHPVRACNGEEAAEWIVEERNPAKQASRVCNGQQGTEWIVDGQQPGVAEKQTVRMSNAPYSGLHRQIPCTCGCLTGQNLARMVAESARELLPKRIIMVRHGESEGNVDKSVYQRKPDNALELTDRGSAQALAAGLRIKGLIGEDKVHLFVSPFQRTLQTARNIALALGDQIIHTEKDPRIREQEFGNLQGADFETYREEQKMVGRYFYRFPTGESGADVYVRVKDWWDSAMLPLNLRPMFPHADTVVVVTHGLTMRLILMSMFMWSPNTFHTVWNAGNCDMYVLRRDLSIPGHSPYRLDPTEGDMPRSTISLLVKFRHKRDEMVRLEDYLSLPMPRTHQTSLVCKMLQEQHGINPDEVESVDFYAGNFKKYL